MQKHKGLADPLEVVAGEISDEAILLCLDEFMVTNPLLPSLQWVEHTSSIQTSIKLSWFFFFTWSPIGNWCCWCTDTEPSFQTSFQQWCCKYSNFSISVLCSCHLDDVVQWISAGTDEKFVCVQWCEASVDSCCHLKSCSR